MFGKANVFSYELVGQGEFSGFEAPKYYQKGLIKY